LDVGTDNDRLLSDDLYIGHPHPRVRGEEYDAFIERFLKACRKLYPKAYVHFEDFGVTNARRILDKYSPQFACFNDDIQGTGCVTLAATYAALQASNETKMQDTRVVVFGSGSAGMGIADQIRDAIAVEGNRSREEASSQIWCVDKQGLLLQSQEGLSEAQRGYSKPEKDWSDMSMSLIDVVKAVKPHVLIGTSTRPKSFTKEIVEEMAKHVSRPIIFPLSNPTRLHEAEPKDLIQWTGGKVLVATGSPFPAVEFDGRKREIAECNNSVCFPGIGLGCVLSRAKLVTPEILVAATKALASQAPVIKQNDPEAPLLPDVIDAREISVHIAAAVIKQVVKDGLAQEDVPEGDGELERWIRQRMWDAEYKSLIKSTKS
jgi:malate dehydrogenase (oxaloacetate-decarboxylating)